MRKSLLLLAAGVGLAIGLARAEPATDDKAFFNSHVGALVRLEPTPLTSAALDDVFGARFYSVEVHLGEEGALTTLIVARVGDQLSTVTTPSTTQQMPALQAVIKPDFKLKTNADAKRLEAALDVLYPIDDRFDKEDLQLKAFRHKGAQWQFIRGKFFDDLKGLVVETDATGTVTGVQFSLEIKK